MTQVQVATRFGRRYSCEISVRDGALCYGSRSFPPNGVEYLHLHESDPACLIIKFVTRARPKEFYFISPDACDEVTDAIRRWQAENAGLTPALMHGGQAQAQAQMQPQAQAQANEHAPPQAHAQGSAGGLVLSRVGSFSSSRCGSSHRAASFGSPLASAPGSPDFGAVKASAHEAPPRLSLSETPRSRLTFADEQLLAPPWPSSSSSRSPKSRAVAMAPHALRELVLTDWCCRTHVAEALLFGVFMPIAVAGYWLIDAFSDVRKRSRQWERAQCEIHHGFLVHWRFYHHGKYADARNDAIREGKGFMLEPAWNCTVRLGGASWEALAFMEVDAADAPLCEGEVGLSLQQTLAMCEARDLLFNWMPKLRSNQTRDCFVQAENDERVYLSTREPPSFYWDILIISSLFAVAAAFGYVLAQVHRESLRRGGAAAARLLRRLRGERAEKRTTRRRTASRSSRRAAPMV